MPDIIRVIIPEEQVLVQADRTPRPGVIISVTLLLLVFAIAPVSERSSAISSYYYDNVTEDEVDIDEILAKMTDLNNSFSVDSDSYNSEEMLGVLNRALNYQRRKQWTKALRAYYHIINHEQDFLCRNYKIDGERVYVGLKEFSRQCVAGFPHDGARAFRLSYDRFVRRRLQAAAASLNLDEMRIIAMDYPLSAYADDAVWNIAGILFELGKYNEAVFYYRDLIRQFPQTDLPLEQAYARIAMCARRTGPHIWKRICGCLNQAPPDVLDRQIRVYMEEFGESVELTLREYLEQTEKALAASGETQHAYKDFNPSDFSALERKWIIERIYSTQGYDAATSDEMLIAGLIGPDENGNNHKEGRIKGFSLDTGKQIFTAQKDNVLSNTTTTPGTGHKMFPATVGIDGDTVYYIDIKGETARANDLRNRYFEKNTYTTDLYACDIETGKLKWIQPWFAQNYGNAGGVPDTEARKILKALCLTTVPVRYGAYLYAAAVEIGIQKTQFYLVCFEADTGVLKWYRRIGSNTTPNYNNSRTSPYPILGSRVTVARNSVFFTSNMGVAGAVNALTGDIRWVAKYHKPAERNDQWGRTKGKITPFIWHETPPGIIFEQVITRNGKEYTVNAFYAAPRDSDTIYAFNADTGARLWERRVTDGLPIRGDNRDFRWVSFSRKRAMIVQNTSHYRPPKYAKPGDYSPENLLLLDLRSGKAVPFNAYLPSGENIRGTPVVSKRYIFVLTDKSLIGYNTDRGEKIVMMASVNNFADGNDVLEIRIVRDKLLIFCTDRIYCYVSADK